MKKTQNFQTNPITTDIVNLTAKLVILALALSLFALPIHAQPRTSGNPGMVLWYDKPASNWNEALPLGNGRLGAMVFGVPAMERLQLNEETLWAGSPNNNAHDLAKEALPEVRRLVFEGKYLEAQNLATQKIMSQTNHGMPYQTMGDLFVSFPGHHDYRNFYRDLNIEDAIATVKYEAKGVQYQREIFSSFTDQVIKMRVTADKPGSITCNLQLNSPHDNANPYTEGNQIVLSGVSSWHEGQPGRVRFQTRVRVENNGGQAVAKDGLISVENADELTVYISMATNFKNYKELTEDEADKCKGYLSNALGKDYEASKKAHTAYYRQYFDRVKFDLGHNEAAYLPTNERVVNFSKTFDPHMSVLYFQFGRYLLISSSQPGGQPANLQGIWNDLLFPPWDSKYTVNINAEMNYWLAEVTNLTELHEPFIQLIREVSETGKETAQRMYGARGWAIHHNTDIWRITGPVDGGPWGMWPTAGAWLCQHLWERYLYSGDEGFLESAYPIMKGAAQFFLDFMVEEPENGWLVVVPSNSPENMHAGSNNKATTAAGVTMDNQLMFDLFSNLIKSSAILGQDQAFADTLKLAREKLPPMQVGKHGQLQEWMHDWDDPNDKHRHVSHLYGVFPSNQISPYRAPELFDAARTSLLFRGDPSTGWSMGWKVCLWARFLDGDHAYKLLNDQMNLVTPGKRGGGTYPNLLDAHPPFQIDGNFGCTAGIAEMLVQSYDGFVYLLPALPSVWKEGNISGLKARGGFELSFSWKDGKITELSVVSHNGGNLRLRSNTPLRAGKGVKAKKARGENPNPLYATPKIKAPLIASEAQLNHVELVQTYLYDIPTEAGKAYKLVGGIK